MNLITANQVTDRCNGLSYLSSEPGAADVLQVVSNIGRYKGPAGRACQPVAMVEAVDFLTIPEVPFLLWWDTVKR